MSTLRRLFEIATWRSFGPNRRVLNPRMRDLRSPGDAELRFNGAQAKRDRRATRNLRSMAPVGGVR